MNVILLTALLLQVVAIVLLRHCLGHYWLRHPVTLISLLFTIYQGISPILLTFQSIGAQDPYRNGVEQSFINYATLLISAGMLIFTIAHLMTRPEWTDVAGKSAGIREVVKAPNWRWLTGACVPVAVLTYEGPARIVLLGGAVIAALSYERGLPGMLLALRSAAAIAVIVKLTELLRARNTHRHSSENVDAGEDFDRERLSSTAWLSS